MLPHKKRILIAPLDWGLGHATRSVPIIHYLISQGAEPVVAAEGRPLAFLREEFPQLEFITLPGYNISYPARGSMLLKMMISAPRIIRAIRTEHHVLEKIISEYRIDAVISDNRFGLWTKKVPCVFITHQLMIKSPLGESILHRINKSYIEKYFECWIPDHEGRNNLSGDLAHKYKLPANAHFTGPLSRFENFKSDGLQKRYDLLVMLSGPEPQRSIFEGLVKEQLKHTTLKTLILQGKPGTPGQSSDDHVDIVSHLDTKALHKAIASSRLIISRPGYSTVMDLSYTGGKAVFVPTPGQTEQEYLAQRLMQKKIAYGIKQDKFNLQNAIEESKSYDGFTPAGSDCNYKKRIDLLLEKL